MSQLLPPGIRDLYDLPWPLFEAIRSALLFLSFDELAKNERPPRRIWLNGKKLAEWFDAVAAQRKREMDGQPAIDDPVDNEYAQGLIVGG